MSPLSLFMNRVTSRNNKSSNNSNSSSSNSSSSSSSSNKKIRNYDNINKKRGIISITPTTTAT